MIEDNKSAFASDKYDENIKMVIPYYDDIYKQIIDLVNLLNINKIFWLDIECGTGTLAEKASKICSISKFVLNDTSENMIEQAKIKLANCNINKIFCIQSSQ